MFILNTLENLIFGKTSAEEPKKEAVNPVEKGFSFNEIFHQTVNTTPQRESENLQAYSTSIIDRAERQETPLNSYEPYKTELFNERLTREIKQSDDNFTSNSGSIEDTHSSSQSNSVQSELKKNSDDNDDLSKIESTDKKNDLNEILKENTKAFEVGMHKEGSSEILLQTFAKVESKAVSPKEEKGTSKKTNSEIKVDNKISVIDTKHSTSKVEQLDKSSDKLNLTTAKEIDSKDSKKIERKVTSSEAPQAKGKESKVEFDSKELLTREANKDNSKESHKEVKAEETIKVSLTPVKPKEIPTVNQKISTESKPEISTANVTNPNPTVHLEKEATLSSNLITAETRKSKKNSDHEAKDKSISENPKPLSRENSGIEKEIRFHKETLVDVAGLDKSKWNITRREKDAEVSNLERKKESLALLSEIALKSNTSQNNSDSDKSFSNPRYETNGFKTFSESLRTANTDKSREAGFDRENFSKSLNELVNKAKINIVDNGKNTAQISLYPKDLGRMTLNIDVTKEKVDGKILVDSEFIKNRLLGDVSQLKADLKASGLDLQTISIEVRSEGSLAFDFANPSNDRESAKEKAERLNSSLPQYASSDENLESEEVRKSYNLVDIKI